MHKNTAVDILMLSTKIYRASWVIWTIGAILVFLNWIHIVAPVIGWTGFVISVFGIVLSVVAHFGNRFAIPPDHTALQHPLARCLPDETSILQEMKLVEQGTCTNAQVAQERKNPEEVLAQFDQAGRVVGVYRHYLNKKGCHSALQWADIAIQVVEYRSREAAQAVLTEAIPENLARFDSYSYVDTSSTNIGEKVKVLTFSITNDCHPSQTLLGYGIEFIQGNLLGIVEVSAVQGTKHPDIIYEYALILARIMEQRMAGFNTSPPRAS
jgi:hypothetical protein